MRHCLIAKPELHQVQSCFQEAIIPYASFSISHAESSQIQLIFSGHGEEMVIKYSASGGDGGGGGGEDWSVN